MGFLNSIRQWWAGQSRHSRVRVVEAAIPNNQEQVATEVVREDLLNIPVAQALMPLREIRQEEILYPVIDGSTLSVTVVEKTGRMPDGRFITTTTKYVPTDRRGQEHGLGSAPCAIDGQYYASSSLVECAAHNHLICKEHAVWLEGVPLCLEAIKEHKRQKLWDMITLKNKRK